MYFSPFFGSLVKFVLISCAGQTLTFGAVSPVIFAFATIAVWMCNVWSPGRSIVLEGYGGFRTVPPVLKLWGEVGFPQP